jgi:Probable cobalt transporter subunit (CbtA)
VASLLRRGLIAGLLAGLVAGLFYLVVGEPVVREALSYERAASGGHAVEVFSRGTQQVGLLAGVLLYGTAMGGVLGFLYALLEPRLAAGSAWDRSLRLAATAFASAWLVPFLKYPSNPPGVGDPATGPERTRLYLAMVAISLAASVGAWLLSRQLAGRGVPRAPRQLAVGAAYLLVILAAYALLPEVRQESAVPAAVLWNARKVSAGGQALLWLSLGVSFGWLSLWEEGARSRVPGSRAAERADPAGR